MTKLAEVWMLVSKGGGVLVLAAPGATRHMAWKNARRDLGAFKALQLRRAGYEAQKVVVTLENKHAGQHEQKTDADRAS